MDEEIQDPYESPKAYTEASAASRLADRNSRLGPAIYIALCALIGGIAGGPLLVDDNAIGFLTVVPGAICGGLIYRIRSRKWPIDPTARARRHGYALAVTLLIPAAIGSVAGLRAQGLGMTLLGLLIGAAIASGVLISGDRRFARPA